MRALQIGDVSHYSTSYKRSSQYAKIPESPVLDFHSAWLSYPLFTRAPRPGIHPGFGIHTNVLGCCSPTGLPVLTEAYTSLPQIPLETITIVTLCTLCPVNHEGGWPNYRKDHKPCLTWLVPPWSCSCATVTPMTPCTDTSLTDFIGGCYSNC